MDKKSLKQSEKQFSSSCNRHSCILIPTMGAQDMPDFADISKALKKRGFQVLSPDLNKRGAIRSIPWDSINIVDLSNMRGCLTSFDRYRGILDYLYDCIIEQERKKHRITIFPDFDSIEWISSKANYLKHLENNGIPTIPTAAICCLKKPEKASIIAQPDNFKQMFKEIQNFINTVNTNRFVLKPSTSSLGRGLIFIDHNSINNDYTVSIPREKNEEASFVVFNGYQNLKQYLMNYFINTASSDNYFLFQEYIPNIETSAVFIDGFPHFIERLQGKKSRIAHARYGGTDSLIKNPNIEMVNFTYRVMRALPYNIQNSPFLRIDIMKNIETGKYILGEIEGAGATRLWLNEANRINDYVNMLEKMTNKSSKPRYPLHATATLEQKDENIATQTNTANAR